MRCGPTDQCHRDLGGIEETEYSCDRWHTNDKPDDGGAMLLASYQCAAVCEQCNRVRQQQHVQQQQTIGATTQRPCTRADLDSVILLHRLTQAHSSLLHGAKQCFRLLRGDHEQERGGGTGELE